MQYPEFKQLLTPSGQEALAAAEQMAPREQDFLPNFSILSKRYPVEMARAALEIAILRQEAQSKFAQAGSMYFNRPALEQASNQAVSGYRAGRYIGFGRLFDLGCSIGGDTLAFAALVPTTGVDRQSLRLAMAQANAQALGLETRATFIQADLKNPLPFSPAGREALFFDPARRVDGRRVYHVADYRPPLSIVESWLASFPALGVKISPAVDMAELAPYQAEVEFISLKGELKEATLWFGPLKTAERRATLLPGPNSLIPSPGMGPDEPGVRYLPLSEPRAYLYEPDPAVLRAGLVQTLGVQLDAAQIDPDIAYLTADHLQQTPFARVWRVEAWLPFNLKRLRRVLQEWRIGRVTVKKRGSPLQPQELIRALRLKGEFEKERLLFLTHLRGRPIVIICLP